MLQDEKVRQLCNMIELYALPNGQIKLHANGDKQKITKERVNGSLLKVKNVKSGRNLDFLTFLS